MASKGLKPADLTGAEILTADEACIILRCSRSTFDHVVRDHLRPINFDSRARYWRKDILAFAEARTGGDLL